MCDSTFDRTLYPSYQRKKALNKEQAPLAARAEGKEPPLPKGFLGKEKGMYDSVKSLLKMMVLEA